MRRVLVIADPRDPLARALARRLPNKLLIASPRSVAASFSIAGDGAVRTGIFVVRAQPLDWQTVSALLVRPGRAWSMPSRFASIGEGMAFHERRTAWCAVLAAFPGVVLDRLPPAWFLDRALYGASLACSLAVRLGCLAGSWPEGAARAPPCGAFVLAEDVIPAESQDDASRAFARWLSAHVPSLVQWQLDSGVRVARIDGCRRDGCWTIEAVDPVPSLARVEPSTLDQRCASVAALLT